MATNARRALPVGAQTYSKAPAAYADGADRRAMRAEGPWVTMADGQRYVDYVAGLGAVSLGYGHPRVDRAVREQMGTGVVSTSVATNLEHELAELLVALWEPHTGAEAARFAKNGADVTSAAVRLCRAATGRAAVAMMATGYHGAQDWSMARPPRNAGVPMPVRGLTHYVQPGDLASLERVLLAARPACLVMEAVISTAPVAMPAGYYAGVRELCARHGTLVVLDEIVSGFRAGWPGAVATICPDLWPDLVCMGKGVANGWPLAALLGPWPLMRPVEHDVFMSSTFGGEAVSLAAALATVRHMREVGLPALLAAYGRRLRASWEAEAERGGCGPHDASLIGYDARPVMRWADTQLRDVWLRAALGAGLLVQPGFNLMQAHLDDPGVEVATTAVFRHAFRAVATTRATTGGGP